MDVRWQGRMRQQPGIGPRHGQVVGHDVRWTADVVESVRVGGKPRERHVALLASITESGIDIAHQRRYFWDAVHNRLDQLGDRMSIDDRRSIEAAIAHKVPGFRVKNTTQASKKSKSTTIFSVGLRSRTSLIGRRREQAPGCSRRACPTPVVVSV